MLSQIAVEMRKELFQFVLCRTPVTLSALTDQTEAFQGDARHLNGLHAYLKTMHRSRMCHDQFDGTNILPQSHWTGALFGTVTTEADQAFAIHVGNT